MSDSSYIDYKFLGVHSFIDSLKEGGAEYRLFTEDDFSPLYAREDTILTHAEDTVRSGIILRDNQRAYFTEFGIKITPGFNSYIVFIFDHHPAINELNSVLDGLESIISSALDTVDLSRLTDAREKAKQGQDDTLN